MIYTQLTDKIRLYNGDNMEFMAALPDKYYDLAICDPPYGIGVSKRETIGGGGNKIKPTKFRVSDWDNAIPDLEYFTKVQRVAKNVIIWGGNYFASMLPYSSCWIVWDKNNGGSDFADCELAWTNFDTAVRKYKYTYNGFIQGSTGKPKNNTKRIHQCQKPIDLYRWLLQKYAKKGDKIFDSHAGSFTHGRACYLEGFEIDGIELDPFHYSDAVAEFEKFLQIQKSQPKLF